MLTSKRNSSRNVLSLVALLAFSAPASPAVRKPDEYVGRARQLIRALYPYLADYLQPVIVGPPLREHGLIDPDLMNVFNVQLFDPQAKPAQPTVGCSGSNLVLTVRFGFDWQTENKELFDLLAWGPAVDGRSDEFAEEVNRHPEWSDAKVSEALNEAGAKYGPDHKAEFLRAFPRELLRPYVGGELAVVAAAFYLRDGFGQAKPTWVVQAKWRSQDGRESDCTLAFESFRGNLTMISLSPVVPNAGEKPGEGQKPKAP